MPIRLSGLASGLDTEAMVKELMSAQRLKVRKVENKKTKLEWKDEKWKELNQKIYKLYTGELSKFKLQSSYISKKISVSDPSKATVTAGSSVPAGTHEIEITGVASSQFVIGNELNVPADTNVNTNTKLVDLKIEKGTKFNIGKTGGKSETFEVTDTTTIRDLSKWAKENGVNMNYDETHKQFFVSSSESGLDHAFTFTSEEPDGNTNGAMNVLGLGEITADGAKGAKNFIPATNTTVKYNGVEFTSGSNTVTVNGLTIQANQVSNGPIRVNITNDTDGVYNFVKNFVKEYNDVLKEVNTLLYADTAKGYDILTDEEKEAMTEEQVEKWEKKIKDSLLRNDSSLANVRSALTSIQSIQVNVRGKSYSLRDFGIGTSDYTEKGLLHIDGDSDDSASSGNPDKLKKAIADDPELVMEVLSGIGKELYDNLSKKMGASSLSSALTLYNDKEIANQKKAYEKEIKKWEKRLEEMEERWYQKFAAMEKAMAKFDSQTSFISGLFAQ